MSTQIDALPEYVAAGKDLAYVAEQLGYITGYGNNYIKTYGNLADNEAAYLLLNIETGCKGSIAWNRDTVFFAHWINQQSRKITHSPYFKNKEVFLSHLLKVLELRP